MRARTVLVALVVAAPAVLGATETARWVERAKVDVRAGRASYHDIVDTVLKGEQVEVVQTEGKWLSVKTPRAKVGWVFAPALSATPVEKGASDFLRLVPGDASTSQTAASQGAKGIYAQNYAQARGLDYGVVVWVEGHQPTAAEIEAFVASPDAPGGRR